jgi:hypothetical protein
MTGRRIRNPASSGRIWSGDRAVVTHPIAACREPGGDLYILQLISLVIAVRCRRMRSVLGGGQPAEGSRCQAHVLVMQPAEVGREVILPASG